VVLFSDANYQTTKLSKINSSASSKAQRQRDAASEQPGGPNLVWNHPVGRERGAKDTDADTSRQPSLDKNSSFCLNCCWRLVSVSFRTFGDPFQGGKKEIHVNN
jgi:hypothetical protein